MTAQHLLGLESPQFWTTDLAFSHLQKIGEVDSKRSTERRLHTLGIWPEELSVEKLQNENNSQDSSRNLNSTKERAGKENALCQTQNRILKWKDCLRNG